MSAYQDALALLPDAPRKEAPVCAEEAPASSLDGLAGWPPLGSGAS